MATRTNRFARFDQIARLCGPCVTDAQIWARIRQEDADAAARTVVNNRNSVWCNEQNEIAFGEFAAADAANGWV